jgi:hypothetical protein
MGKNQKQAWIVCPRPGGIRVPILQREVVRTFKEAGWEVERVPTEALDPLELWALGQGKRRFRANPPPG